MNKNQAFDVLLIRDRHQVTLSERVRETFEVECGDSLFVEATPDKLIIHKVKTNEQWGLEEVMTGLIGVIDQYLYEPDQMDGSSLIFSQDKVLLNHAGTKITLDVSVGQEEIDSIIQRLLENSYRSSILLEYRDALYSIHFLPAEYALNSIVTVTRVSAVGPINLLKEHHVERFLLELSERNQTIVRMKHGWGKYKTPLRVDQIALKMDLAESSVYRIIQKFESNTAAAQIRDTLDSI